MTKYIVTVFDNEKAAYEGSRALRQLDAEASVAVYADAVLSKDADGNVGVEDAADEGPIGTATGMLIGGLIGAIGGPSTMVAGAAGGMLGGWLTDMYNVGVDGEFLDDVGNAMSPGTYAVVAEVAEGWTAPVDATMENLGGTVFRKHRIDVEDEQIERDIKATNRELDELEAELAQAEGEAKAKLNAKVEAARAKVEALAQRAEKKSHELKSEVDAKVAKLNQQIDKAEGEAKTRFQRYRDDLKAGYEKRSAKLKEACRLTSEALT